MINTAAFGIIAGDFQQVASFIFYGSTAIACVISVSRSGAVVGGLIIMGTDFAAISIVIIRNALTVFVHAVIGITPVTGLLLAGIFLRVSLTIWSRLS